MFHKTKSQFNNYINNFLTEEIFRGNHFNPILIHLTWILVMKFCNYLQSMLRTQ